MTKLLMYELRKTPILFLFISLLIMLAFKGIVAITFFNEYDKEWRDLYSHYLVYASDHDINVAEEKLTLLKEDFTQHSTEVAVIDTILEQLNNRKHYETIQKVALVESGFSFNMPPDFNKFRSAYASYDLPDIINVLGYQLFIELNQVNFLPIIIILAFSSIFSIERETGMQSIIRATGMGWSKIFRNKLAITIGISALIFSLGYIIDLILTFSLSDFRSVNSSFRSIISSVLSNDNIGVFLTKYYIVGIVNTIFISCIVLLLSSLSKNSKLAYAINGLIFVAFAVIGFSIDKLDKVAIFITGNFIKFYTETSLFIVPNSTVIIEQSTIILLTYIIFIPFLTYRLHKSS